MVTLFAAVVGPVEIDLNASIPMLLDALEAELMDYGLPHEFTAYTAKRGDAWLHGKSREYSAIVDGDGDETVAAEYFTPAARLDPSKTVRDYFNDAPLDYTAHLVLQWSPAARAQRSAMKAHRAAMRAARDARRVAEQQQEAACARQALQATMETLRFRATTTTKATAPPRETSASWWCGVWGSSLSSDACAGRMVLSKATKAD